MVAGFWILLSIMNNHHQDGEFDVMIDYQKKFKTKYECNNFIKINTESYTKSVLQHYNDEKTIQKVLCAPEKNIFKFLSSKV